MKHDKLYILHYKILKLYNKVSIIFLDVILPLNVIERHLRDIAAFIILDNVLFTRFLSQVDFN